MLAQFAGAQVQLENSKSEPPAKLVGLMHLGSNPVRKGVYHGVSLADRIRGEFPASPLLSASYLGTPLPARKNRPSIVSISGAAHSQPTSARSMQSRSQGGFNARREQSPQFRTGCPTAPLRGLQPRSLAHPQ